MENFETKSIAHAMQVLDNGTLVFLPFAALQYRQDVHSSVYRCRAHNAHGAIVSRDMRVQAARKPTRQLGDLVRLKDNMIGVTWVSYRRTFVD
ncbi:unnamed protein product [Colias eurytheme]|nr:unnamed protein product [Colias eurytheme]